MVESALLTDLYQLTMGASYRRHGLTGPATFELFVRRLPVARNFLVACGVADALEYLESLRFDATEVAYLASLGMFDGAFLDYLAGFRFTGDVRAVAEGTVVFAGEPLLEVRAPRVEAQLVETALLNSVLFQTMVASKAARVAIACEGRPFADFGARRAHGPGAALKAARAAYIGGAAATSNVLAGQCYGMPVTGTMAHSYVLSFANEADAFRAYARDFPDSATLLIDTHDTLVGARTAARVALELAGEGIHLRAVRLDSGDLGALSRSVREILDEAELPDVRIVASGDLDETAIAALVAAGAPIDSFGVGTQLSTSADAPFLAGVYKLVEDGSGPLAKHSAGKVTLPGRKQVFRSSNGGRFSGDIIARGAEQLPGEALLQPVMQKGKRITLPESLETIRARRERSMAALPTQLLSLAPVEVGYPVDVSAELSRLAAQVRDASAGRSGDPARP